MEFEDFKRQSPIAYIGYLYKHFHRYCDKQLAPYGLSNGLYFYLFYISRYPDCSLTAMASDLRADKAQVTRTVNKLSTLGYISKTKSEIDSRAFVLHLSEEGTETLYQLRDLFSTWNQPISDSFTKEEFNTFMTLLQKAMAAIK